MKFNKKSALTTAKNVLIGGAANAAIDAAVQSVEAFSSIKTIDPLYVDGAKVLLGSVAGAAVSPSSIWRAAADGVATVGASNLAAQLIEKVIPASGVPFMGGVGRVRMGQRGFKRAGVRGAGSVPFMG